LSSCTICGFSRRAQLHDDDIDDDDDYDFTPTLRLSNFLILQIFQLKFRMVPSCHKRACSCNLILIDLIILTLSGGGVQVVKSFLWLTRVSHKDTRFAIMRRQAEASIG
jgi:hypothetical protein